MVQIHGGPTAGAIPGSQWQNAAVVDAGGAVRVFDPSGASPTVSIPYAYQISGIIANTGSVGLIGAHFNGSVWALRMTNGSNLLVDIGNLGSVAITTTNLGSVSIASTILGSVYILSNPVPVSGLINQGGAPWTFNGSVRQLDDWKVEQIRGVFGWSGTSFTGSFTGSVVYTPGTGSKLFLKGFTATSDVATKFGLRFSGGTSTFVGNFILPNSGTMTSNLMGFEPSGATNQPIMVNLYSAGSLDISLGVRESL